MATDLTDIERAAIEMAELAGAIAMRHWRRVADYETKSASTDIVTEADYEVEALLRDEIERRFPGHGFIGEESASGGDASQLLEHAWIVDPIDGTVNFAHGLDRFAVSIAYWRAGEPAVGVVACPPRGDVFAATRDAGARRNGQPIRVTSTDDPQRALSVTGFGYDRQQHPEKYLDLLRRLMLATQGVRRFGSAALDLASIATGELDIYAERSLRFWDFAAGCLIVEEAGGRVTDFSDSALGPAGSDIVATNGRLHAAALKMLE